MKISREWAMPSSNTFSIPPIRRLVERVLGGIVVDPFVGGSPFLHQCRYTNDLNPTVKAHSHKDAREFLQELPDACADLVLFDPPYSPRQVSEVYKRFSQTVNMQTTQSAYWAILKKEIARITKTGGMVVTCSWNSGGIGKSYGFVLTEVLLVPHGGWHNDTIVTLETRLPQNA